MDCHRAANHALNISTDETFTISTSNLYQYGTTEGMFATPGITSLLVSLESMTAKPRASEAPVKVMKSEYVDN